MIAAWRAISSSQRAALLALLALAALVNIDQPYPALAPLHHIPTLALIFSAPWWLRRWPLNDGELLCLVGFLALHSIAARWTYSYVPYDAWAQAVSGTTINELFGWNRNHFDRLVHLAFGALLLPAVAEWMRPVLANRTQRLIAAVILLLAASAAYELFEWLLTLFMAPGAAEAYNGQQGDMWDAHKDMALALSGSVVAALWLGWRGDKAI